MTLSETAQLLGNFGEFFGAVIVVATLIYLARQVRDNSEFIRENTKASLAATEFSSNRASREFTLATLADSELSEILEKGSSGDSLNKTDALKFALWVRAIFEGHMTYFVQRRRGIVRDEIWGYWSRVFDGYCRQPGVASVWKRIRSNFDPAFCKYIDAKISPSVR